MDIISFIPHGEANAISRKELVEKTGLTDRAMRESIEQARHRGKLICSSTKGGYYQPENIEEIERMYWADKHRALSILHRMKTMRYLLKREGRPV